MAKEFHAAFGLPRALEPQALAPERVAARTQWMCDELREFAHAPDLCDQADALLDLVYLALGCFVEMGVDPTELFALVHQANMAKLWPDGSARIAAGGKVEKPPGWQGPRERLLRSLAAQGAARQARPSSEGDVLKVLLLFSGPLAVGKTSVADELIRHHGFARVRTGSFLQEVAATRGISATRTGLQDLGDELDERTDYRWPLDDVAVPAMNTDPTHTRWLLDSVRKAPQIERFRAALGESVVHVHFTASEEVIRARYNTRLTAGDDYMGGIPYEAAIAHPNEVSSRALGSTAQVTMDTAVASPADIARELVRRFGEPRT